MSRYVKGVGPRDAKIVIVGEAPGATEEHTGVPFVGASGKFLNVLLQNVGISRNECYVTNVVKQRPPKNDFGVFYNDAKRTERSLALEKAIEELREEISKIKPNVIIALGSEALRALTNRQGIEKWRGSIIKSDLGKVVPTYHPSYLLRMYPHKTIAEMDLRKAKEESLSSHLDLPEYRFQPDPTFDEVMDFLGSKHERLSFDIETTSRGLRCLGFGTGPFSAICIPFMVQNDTRPSVQKKILVPEGSGGINSRWTLKEEQTILEGLNRLFLDSSILKCAHNFPFDATGLAREFGFHVNGLEMDTMLAFHTCYCELPKNLDFLTSVYTRAGLYSNYDPSNDYETFVYNCYDCAVTFECWDRLREELKDLEVEDFFYYQQMPALYSVATMSNRGVLVDLEAREEMAQKTREEMAKIRGRLAQLLGTEDFNPKSVPQVRELLYERLRLPVQLDAKTKRPTTNDKAVQQLKKKAPQHAEVMDAILDYRKKQTLLSTFLESEVSSDGRMRSSFNLSGTVTGRLSSSETIDGEGGNLQNIPQSVRRIYKPDRHRVMILADLSQAEFRFVVWDGKMLDLVEKYANDPEFDIHTENASKIYDIPKESVTPKLRDKAKPIAHGGNYKIGPRRASLVYGLDYYEANEKLEKYRRAVPEVPQWWDKVQTELVQKRSTQNPFGRKRIFFDRVNEDSTLRGALSWRAQSTVSDLINRALWVLDHILPGCEILLQVHDEIVLQCPPHLVEKTVRLIRNVMEYPIPFPEIDTPLVIPTEPSVGPSWSKQEQTDVDKWLTSDKCGACFHALNEESSKCEVCGNRGKWSGVPVQL